MPTIAPPIGEYGTVRLLTAASALVTKNATSGALQTVLSWDNATGDITYERPVGTNSGGGTRRHVFAGAMVAPSIAIAGATTTATLSVAGQIKTTAAGVAAATFSKEATLGATLSGATGTTYDLTLLNANGANVVAGVPTGTQTLRIIARVEFSTIAFAARSAGSFGIIGADSSVNVGSVTVQLGDPTAVFSLVNSAFSLRVFSITNAGAMTVVGGATFQNGISITGGGFTVVGGLTLTSGNARVASSGATLTLYDSQTSAVNAGGIVALNANNAAGTETTYARLRGALQNGTVGADSSDVAIDVRRVGVLLQHTLFAADGSTSHEGAINVGPSGTLALAAPTSYVRVTAAAGADRTLLRVGVIGVTNGLQADYTHATTSVLYTLNGNVFVTGKFGINGVGAIAKTTLSGSRGGNAAVASIIATLVAYGFSIDSTTA